MLLSMAVNGSTYLDLLPDYLVLAVFCITLYYKERLGFFDLLVKRGAFFALALVGLAAFFDAEPAADSPPPAAAVSIALLIAGESIVVPSPVAPNILTS